MRVAILPILAAAGAAAALPSQDPTQGRQPAQGQLRSGPAPGTALAPVKVYASSGPRAGHEFDAAAALGKQPGALLFVHEISRNVAPVIRGLDQLTEEFALLGFRSFAVRLDDDRTHAEERTKTVSGALRMANPIVVSLDGAEGPGDYALNRKCTLTLVLTKNGAAHRSVAFTDTGNQDVAKLRGWIEEVAGVLPTDEAGLRALLLAKLPDDPETLKRKVVELTLQLQRLKRRQANERANRGRGRNMRAGQGRGNEPRRGATSRPGQPDAAGKKREGKPPEDPRLRELLRSAIRKTQSAEGLEEAFAAIEQRVGDDPALRQQAVEMFRLMLSLDYGNEDARRRARTYVEKHGPTKPAGKKKGRIF